MAGVGYVAALVLAAVLGWAGIAKLSRPRTTAAGFAALGLPAPAALARAVPLAEIVTAATLVVAPRIGAVAALVLLAAFSVVLVGAVRSNDDVSCGCFGASGRAPVSFVELVRNAMLLAAALAALATPTPVAPGLDDLVAATTAAAVAVLVLALCRLRRDTGAVWAVDLRMGP